MSNLGTPLLLQPDNTTEETTAAYPSRARAYSIDYLFGGGGAVFQRLLGASKDSDINNDNDSDEDCFITPTNRVRVQSLPVIVVDKREEGEGGEKAEYSRPPATITMNVNTDMEYDGADIEEEKMPTPIRTPSHISCSSSVTSSAMIVLQEDGMCTYAYYDEESWNGNAPLHFNQQQPQQPHQQYPPQLHEQDEDAISRSSRRIRSQKTLHGTSGEEDQHRYVSADESGKDFLRGFPRIHTTDSESSSSLRPLRAMGSNLLAGRGASGDGGDGGGGSGNIGVPIESALNKQNVLNFTCLVGNLVVVGLVGVWKLNGRLRNVVEVWDEQQTLISPARWSLLIWPLIFLLETIFAFAQLTPSFRSRPIVQEGTSYFFVHACLGQMGWMLFFSYSMFLIAFFFILYTLISLSSLKISQDFVLNMHRGSTGRTNHAGWTHRTNPHTALGISDLLTKMKGTEYWFLRFPFHLHLGWTMIVTGVTLVMLIVRYGAGSVAELTASLVVLSMWLLVAFFFVIVLSPGGGGALDFTIPFVVIWAYIGVGMSLQDPNYELAYRFGGDEISGLSATSFALAILVGMCILPGFAFRIFREQFTISVTEVE